MFDYLEIALHADVASCLVYFMAGADRLVGDLVKEQKQRSDSTTGLIKTCIKVNFGMQTNQEGLYCTQVITWSNIRTNQPNKFEIADIVW